MNEKSIYLEALRFGAVHHFEEEGGEDVEALAVADGLVPAGVREQDALEEHLVGQGVVAAKQTAARPVQVLQRQSAE